MSEIVAQLLAAALLIGVAAIAGYIGYRFGWRRGLRDALALGAPATPEEPAKRPRAQRPPRPPRSVH